MSVPALEMNVLRPLMLSEPEGAQRAPLGERSQPALPLRVVSEQIERQRADRHVRLPGGGHGLVRQPDLLHGGDETDGRHADAAPLFGDEHAEQAELAHLTEEVGRTARLVPGQRRPGRDLLLRKVATEPDQVPFRFAEGKVHGCS